MLIKVYKVSGMTTKKSKENIEKYVARLHHVVTVEANIKTSEVCVTTEKFIDDKLDKLITGLGYTLEENFSY